MARKALLIGTSKYLDGFKPLKSAFHDVGALAKLLNNSEIGRFDEVQVEMDLESSILAEKIEAWYLGHVKDDFVLLFLVGHGVKDADRKLHFAATNTKKVGEKLMTTTAIAASDVSRWMGGSKAKRQIVILNCCFSGAFGDLVPMDEGAIDVEEAIGADGRVVMTSTSSMDYAFERISGDLSVYGHYLEEGLRTGAAAAPESDDITIDRLHQYVSRKVQEEAPSMVPKIFAKGEGYQLRIAKVALGDPLVQYRKRVEEIIQEDGGDEICEVFSRPILEELQSKLAISNDDAIAIEKSVLEPIVQYRSKLNRYQGVVEKAVLYKYPFGDRENKRLEQLKNMLGLLEKDAAMIRDRTIALIPKPIVPPTSEVPLTKGDLGGSSIETKPIPPAPLVRGSRIIEGERVEFQSFREDLGNGVFIEMMPIPGGTFMGAKIEPFFMSRTLITQAQWEAVTKSKTFKQVKIDLPVNPSHFKKGLKRPVDSVNWWQAEEFCARLEIATPHDYRLPSEAQWEYACRSGTTTEFYFGDELLPKHANYGNKVKETTDVETYPPNAWGLYDMHGNLREWCADHWRDKLETPLKDSNPYISSNFKANRVLRGGSWIFDPVNCGSAYRYADSPSLDFFKFLDDVGVRLVCSRSRTLS